MYAIIKDGGKQYKITPGESLLLESKDLETGAKFDFDSVLLYADGDEVRIGTPTLKNVTVTGEVEGCEKGDKITVIKFRRRKDSQTKKGHRQRYTRVKITHITAS